VSERLNLPSAFDRTISDQVATLRDALNDWLLTPIAPEDLAASVADLQQLAIAFAFRSRGRHCAEDLSHDLPDASRPTTESR